MTITASSIKEEPSINSRISLYHRDIDSREFSDFNLYTQPRKTRRCRCLAILRSCAPTTFRYHPLVTQDLSFYEITPANVNPFCATFPLRALVKIVHCAHRVTHPPRRRGLSGVPEREKARRAASLCTCADSFAIEGEGIRRGRISARSNLRGHFSPALWTRERKLRSREL